MSQWGDACGPNCGWCGACTSGPRTNTICGRCEREFWNDGDDLIGALCDACCDARDEAQPWGMQTLLSVTKELEAAAVSALDSNPHLRAWAESEFMPPVKKGA